MAIGDYPHRLAILSRRTDKDPAYGQAVSSWPERAAAWGRVEEVSAGESGGFQQTESRAEVVITIRGRIVLSANDRIRKAGTGETYRLEGVRRTDFETICSGFRLTEKE